MKEDENPWISVDDEMPPKREWVRVWCNIDRNSFKLFEGHDYRYDMGWGCHNNCVVTHWQRIIGPKKPTSPVMVEAPNEKNTATSDKDPCHGLMNPPNRQKIWWNNKKDHRLWYWHNDQWNRAI